MEGLCPPPTDSPPALVAPLPPGRLFPLRSPSPPPYPPRAFPATLTTAPLDLPLNPPPHLSSPTSGPLSHRSAQAATLPPPVRLPQAPTPTPYPPPVPFPSSSPYPPPPPPSSSYPPDWDSKDRHRLPLPRPPLRRAPPTPTLPIPPTPPTPHAMAPATTPSTRTTGTEEGGARRGTCTTTARLARGVRGCARDPLHRWVGGGGVVGGIGWEAGWGGRRRRLPAIGGSAVVHPAGRSAAVWVHHTGDGGDQRDGGRLGHEGGQAVGQEGATAAAAISLWVGRALRCPRSCCRPCRSPVTPRRGSSATPAFVGRVRMAVPFLRPGILLP